MVHNTHPGEAPATEPAGVTPPIVTPSEAADDYAWFAKHPGRRFRARAGDGGTWFVRRLRRGEDDIYLRSFSPGTAHGTPSGAIWGPAGDSDGELAVRWVASCYPGWPPARCRASFLQ